MKILGETLSICQACMDVVPAEIVERDNKVFMKKNHCEPFEMLLENDAEYYKKMVLPFHFNNGHKIGQNFEEIREIMRREARVYVAVVTTRCNLKCPICFEKYICKRPDPSQEEIMEHARKNKHRYMFNFSGGEPTLREDLPELIERLSGEFEITCLFTNGIKLADFGYVKKLKDAGLTEVFISLDSFEEEHLKFFRNEKLLETKLKALENLKKLKIPTYIFAVVEKGVNFGQIKRITEYACQNTDFIEGVYFSALFKENPVTTQSDIAKQLMEDFDFSVDYLAEYRKLKAYAYRLMKKHFKQRFEDFFLNTFPFKATKNGIVPIFSVDELKGMNRTMENLLNGKLSFNMRSLLNILRIGLNHTHSFSPSFAHMLQRRRKWLRVMIGGVGDKTNYDLERLGVFSDDENMLVGIV